MDEQFIKDFLDQVRKDKFNIKDSVNFDKNLTTKNVFLNDSNKAYSLDSDDEFFEAFENFAQLICPKVEAGELKCKHMSKSIKEKKLKNPCKEKVQFEEVKKSINSECHYQPKIKYKYNDGRITMPESLETMRELRIKVEELNKQINN